MLISGRVILLSCFGEGVEISRNRAPTHFLVFDGQPGNCHGPVGMPLSLLMFYNEHILRLKL